MIKFLMVLTLGLAPFFLQASNIFEDGTVDLKDPKIESNFCITAQYGGTSRACADTEAEAKMASCSAVASAKPTSTFTDSWPHYGVTGYTCKENNGSYELWVQQWQQQGPVYSYSCYCYIPQDIDSNEAKVGVFSFSDADSAEYIKTCPPDVFPTYTIPVEISSGLKCANLFDIEQSDECGPDNSEPTLNIEVTLQSGCHTTANGSNCAYTATSQNGSDYYVHDIGSELNCYVNEQEYALTGTEIVPPVDPPECTVDCEEPPVDPPECTVDCEEPPVDPPECTVDCEEPPVDPPECTVNCGETGGEVDLSGVIAAVNEVETAVDELKEVTKEMDKKINETDVTRNDAPNEGLKGFYKSEYESRGGFSGVMSEKMAEAQDTQLFSFLDQFKGNIGGGSATNYSMCFNLGSMGNFGCQSFVIDPRVFGAIKIFILITAGFLCRRIIFGG